MLTILQGVRKIIAMNIICCQFTPCCRNQLYSLYSVCICVLRFVKTFVALAIVSVLSYYNSTMRC